MKIAVFGDINSNYMHLAQFFKDAAHLDRFVHLGDIVHHNSLNARKYNNRVLDLMRAYAVQGVRGNHDRLFIESPAAELSARNLEYLIALPEELTMGQALFVHESPTRRRLLISRQSEFDLMRKNYTQQRITFFGHTHKRLHLQERDHQSNYFPSFDTPYDISSGLHLINPGTINGARFPLIERASYVVYDTVLQTATFKPIKLLH